GRSGGAWPRRRCRARRRVRRTSRRCEPDDGDPYHSVDGDSAADLRAVRLRTPARARRALRGLAGGHRRPPAGQDRSIVPRVCVGPGAAGRSGASEYRNVQSAPPGWSPDPPGGGQRYFDGGAWTDHTAPYSQPPPPWAAAPPWKGARYGRPPY